MTREVKIKSERCLPEFAGKLNQVSIHRHVDGGLEIALHFQIWEGCTGWNIAWRSARMLWVAFWNRRGVWVGRPKPAKKAEVGERPPANDQLEREIYGDNIMYSDGGPDD